MSKARITSIVAILLLALSVSGCGPLKDKAIFQASMDLNCEEEDLKAWMIHPDVYRVKGCEQEATYECSPTEEQCFLQETNKLNVD